MQGVLPRGFISSYNTADMSYESYSTSAIVLGSYDNATADKSYRLFTERAGMLYASARSVREERSRQRYALQDFSHISVTLIRGKTGWRIGSVEAKENFFMQATTRATRGSIVKVCKVLRRYVHGEEPQPVLYQEFLEAIRLLGEPDLPARESYELCVIVRLLSHLGYVALTPDIAPLCMGAIAAMASTDVLAAHDDLRLAYSAAQAVTHLEQ
jgi:recombinational DNA repair protein (RecF pathway)